MLLRVCETYLSESVALSFLVVCARLCVVLVFIEAASSMTHPCMRQWSLGSLADKQICKVRWREMPYLSQTPPGTLTSTLVVSVYILYIIYAIVVMKYDPEFCSL